MISAFTILLPFRSAHVFSFKPNLRPKSDGYFSMLKWSPPVYSEGVIFYQIRELLLQLFQHPMLVFITIIIEKRIRLTFTKLFL